MNRGRVRWLLRLAALLVAGLAVLLWATGRRSSLLTVENRSGQSIAFLRITIAGETKSFNDVPSGTEVTAPFQVRSDDRFTLEGRLEDGTMVRGHFGYVLQGLTRESVHFLVLPGGEIKFHQGDRPPPR
jgi:hypothetical protein